MRRGHPLESKEELAEEDFFNSDHILYTVPLVYEEKLVDFVDRTLHQENNSNCLLETTQLLMAIETALQSDALLLLPPSTKDLSFCNEKLTEKSINDMPISEAAKNLYLTQHQRSLNVPLLQWVAEEITEVVNQFFPQGHPSNTRSI